MTNEAAEPLPDQEIYAALGEAGFADLVGRFYAKVRADDVIGPMYPPGDWDNAQWRLRAFLDQRFGGPTTYSEIRGHPRLRARHMPFPIGPAARDRWLELMGQAMDEAAVPPRVRAALEPFFTMVATQMMNRPAP